LAIDPPRGTTREERAWQRAEEAAERENRALEREQREMTSAGVRHRDFTVRVREGFVTSCQGGIGGSRLGTRRRCNLGTRNREAGVTQNQEEVDVLEMVVADGDQAVEEIREVEEEDPEGVIEEVGPGDLADREVVELDEDEAEEGMAGVQLARVRPVRVAGVRIEEVEELSDVESYVVINDNFVVDVEEEDLGGGGGEGWVDQVGVDNMEELIDDMEEQVDDMVDHVDDMEEQVDDLVDHVDDMVEQVNDMEEHVDDMVEYVDDVDDMEEQVREVDEQEENNLVEQAEDDQVLLVEAQDDDPEGVQDVDAEAAQGVHAEVGDVDGSADPPLSDTIDLTDSPRPTSRPLDPLQCPVCLDLLRSLPEWKEVVTTPCGHLFCSTCLATALRSVWQCPTCRGRTQPGEAIKIFL